MTTKEKPKKETREYKKQVQPTTPKSTVHTSSVASAVHKHKKQASPSDVPARHTTPTVIKEKKEKPETGKVKERKSKKKTIEVTLTTGKRKEAVARASISAGKGHFIFNGLNIDAIQNKYIREIIKEPLAFVGPETNNLNISVSVRGGGQMGRAQAARTAIAKALVEYTHNEELKKAYIMHDRSLIIDDARRVEAKKFKGPKARARFQKSYR